MTEIDSSLDLEEEKKEAERNINTINSVLVPYTISEESMDEEEEMELLKQEEEEEDRVEVKQEVREALNNDVDMITPRVKSKPDCSVGTSALDQPIVLDVKDLERGEQAEILGSEETIHSEEIEGFPSQEEVDEKLSTKLAAAESVPGDELKDELKASPTLEPEASLEQPNPLPTSAPSPPPGRQLLLNQKKNMACTKEPCSITRRGKWLA